MTLKSETDVIVLFEYWKVHVAKPDREPALIIYFGESVKTEDGLTYNIFLDEQVIFESDSSIETCTFLVAEILEHGCKHLSTWAERQEMSIYQREYDRVTSELSGLFAAITRSIPGYIVKLHNDSKVVVSQEEK